MQSLTAVTLLTLIAVWSSDVSGKPPDVGCEFLLNELTSPYFNLSFLEQVVNRGPSFIELLFGDGCTNEEIVLTDKVLVIYVTRLYSTSTHAHSLMYFNFHAKKTEIRGMRRQRMYLIASHDFHEMGVTPDAVASASAYGVSWNSLEGATYRQRASFGVDDAASLIIALVHIPDKGRTLGKGGKKNAHSELTEFFKSFSNVVTDKNHRKEQCGSEVRMYDYKANKKAGRKEYDDKFSELYPQMHEYITDYLVFPLTESPVYGGKHIQRLADDSSAMTVHVLPLLEDKRTIPLGTSISRQLDRKWAFTLPTPGSKNDVSSLYVETQTVDLSTADQPGFVDPLIIVRALPFDNVKPEVERRKALWAGSDEEEEDEEVDNTVNRGGSDGSEAAAEGTGAVGSTGGMSDHSEGGAQAPAGGSAAGGSVDNRQEGDGNSVAGSIGGMSMGGFGDYDGAGGNNYADSNGGMNMGGEEFEEEDDERAGHHHGMRRGDYDLFDDTMRERADEEEAMEEEENADNGEEDEMGEPAPKRRRGKPGPIAIDDGLEERILEAAYKGAREGAADGSTGAFRTCLPHFKAMLSEHQEEALQRLVEAGTTCPLKPGQSTIDDQLEDIALGLLENEKTKYSLRTTANDGMLTRLGWSREDREYFLSLKYAQIVERPGGHWGLRCLLCTTTADLQREHFGNEEGYLIPRRASDQGAKFKKAVKRHFDGVGAHARRQLLLQVHNALLPFIKLKTIFSVRWCASEKECVVSHLRMWRTLYNGLYNTARAGVNDAAQAVAASLLYVISDVRYFMYQLWEVQLLDIVGRYSQLLQRSLGTYQDIYTNLENMKTELRKLNETPWECPIIQQFLEDDVICRDRAGTRSRKGTVRECREALFGDVYKATTQAIGLRALDADSDVVYFRQIDSTDPNSPADTAVNVHAVRLMQAAKTFTAGIVIDDEDVFATKENEERKRKVLAKSQLATFLRFDEAGFDFMNQARRDMAISNLLRALDARLDDASIAAAARTISPKFLSNMQLQGFFLPAHAADRAVFYEYIANRHVDNRLLYEDEFKRFKRELAALSVEDKASLKAVEEKEDSWFALACNLVECDVLGELFSAVLAFPPSTAEVERVFSQLSYIKDARSSRLRSENLDHRIRIRLNGVSPDLWNPIPTVNKFLSRYPPSDDPTNRRGPDKGPRKTGKTLPGQTRTSKNNDPTRADVLLQFNQFLNLAEF